MAAVSTGRFIVRPAGAGDLTDVQAVISRAGLSSGQPAALDFYLKSPGGHLIVGGQEGQVTGVAYAVSFGPTGWLGNVAVDPGHRGHGYGRALSAAAVDWLRQGGVSTVLLTATDLGRPVYQRLRFTDEGVPYAIWTRDQPRPAGDGDEQLAPGRFADAVRGDAAAAGGEVVAPGRFADALRQDAAATGEDRGAYLSTFAARVRTPAGRDAEGYRVALPWGGGPVVASDPESARALVADLLRADPEHSLAFPDSNAQAAELAASLGFHPVRRCTRMRLGPPVREFRPERIFNVFSLAVG